MIYNLLNFFFRLEHFFREAYALTFGLKPGEKRKFEEVTSDVIMVMRTTLSKKEFASALGMKEGDVFVTKMFNIVDKDGDGRISFQEFLDTIVLFSKGRTDDKLRIIFDMCDDDKSGSIDKGKYFFYHLFKYFIRYILLIKPKNQ